MYLLNLVPRYWRIEFLTKSKGYFDRHIGKLICYYLDAIRSVDVIVSLRWYTVTQSNPLVVILSGAFVNG